MPQVVVAALAVAAVAGLVFGIALFRRRRFTAGD